MGGSGARRGSRGHAVPLFLLNAIALVLVVLLVLNTAEHLRRRIEVQNAADAHALTQATWTARTMNLMAMNQVAMTQALAVSVGAEALQILVIPALADAIQVETRLFRIALAACTLTLVGCSAWAEFLRWGANVVVPWLRLERILIESNVLLRFSAIAKALSSMNDHLVETFPAFMDGIERRLADDNRVEVPSFYPRDEEGRASTPLPVRRIPLDALPELCIAGRFGALESFRQNFASHRYPLGEGVARVVRKDLSERLMATSFDPRRSGPLHHSSAWYFPSSHLPGNDYGWRSQQERDDNSMTRTFDRIWLIQCLARRGLGGTGELAIYHVPVTHLLPRSEEQQAAMSLLAFTRRDGGAAVSGRSFEVATERTYAYAEAEVVSTRQAEGLLLGPVGLPGSFGLGHYDLYSQGWVGRLVPSHLIQEHRDEVVEVLRETGYRELGSTFERLEPPDLEFLNAH